MTERLQKVMAQAGLGARRTCEEMIRQKRVRVNGEVALLGQKVDPRRDKITVDGKPLQGQEKKRYLIVHKPPGYITSVKDQFGRKNVVELLRGVSERVFPAGRLDYDSEGLVFLTNDGALAHRIMHPRFQLPKIYLVQLEGRITKKAVEHLRRGVPLEDGLTSPAEVEIISSQGKTSLLRLTLREGRNRQIRRMTDYVGFSVLRLSRIGLGPLGLGRLSPGEFRDLSPSELRQLRRAVKRS